MGDRPAPDEWGGWSLLATQEAARFAPLAGWDAHDAAQDALVRMLITRRKGKRIRSPVKWLRATIRRLAIDAARHRGLDRGLAGDDALARVAAPSSSEPERRAALDDLWTRAPDLFALLPPPCWAIATFELLEDWPRRRIVARLCRLRPVGTSEASRLISITHELLLAMGRSEDLRAVWPSGFDPGKNPWFTIDSHCLTV